MTAQNKEQMYKDVDRYEILSPSIRILHLFFSNSCFLFIYTYN